MKGYRLLILVGVVFTLSACASRNVGGEVDRSLNTDGLGTGNVVQNQAQVEEDPVVEAPAPLETGPIPGSRGDFIISVQDRVFFGVDSYTLTAGARSVLNSQIQWLKRYPSVLVTIEGHTDERGTREYNLALSEQRANAVSEYMNKEGIRSSRIRTIGYGKERPAVLGSTESAWGQNRRATTVIEE